MFIMAAFRCLLSSNINGLYFLDSVLKYPSLLPPAVSFIGLHGLYCQGVCFRVPRFCLPGPWSLRFITQFTLTPHPLSPGWPQIPATALCFPVSDFWLKRKGWNSFFLFFFFFLINFYWSIVALQCCVSFYCMAKLISYTYTHIPTFLDFLPI